jgi:hypothetical protein
MKLPECQSVKAKMSAAEPETLMFLLSLKSSPMSQLMRSIGHFMASHLALASNPRGQLSMYRATSSMLTGTVLRVG